MVYLVMDRYDNLQIMTAKEIYERVKNDSERGTSNWLASAAELTRITGRPFFSDDYAIGIRAMILNCFAFLERQRSCGGGGRSVCKADRQALQECYNSLYGVDKEEAIRARKQYLTEMVRAATRATDHWDFIAHPGRSFHVFCDEWIRTKCLEYYEKDFVDFEKMYETLRPEWLKLKKGAEDRGDFKEDDDKERDMIGRLVCRAGSSDDD